MHPPTVPSGVERSTYGPLSALKVCGPEPTVVLVHGWCGSAASFRPVLERWSGSQAAIAVDLPGCGASPPLDDAPRFVRQASALADAVDTAGIAASVVVGWSMGGMVLLEYLLAGSPASAAAFVGIGPRNVSGPDYPHGRPAARYLAILDLLLDDPERALGQMVSQWSAGRSVDPGWLVAQAVQTDPLVRLAGLVGLAQADFRNRLTCFDMPVLQVHGMLDAQVPSESGDLLAELIGAERLQIPGVGHMPFLEAPTAFDRAVARLVEQAKHRGDRRQRVGKAD